MATQTQRPSVNGATPKRPTPARAPVKRPAPRQTPNGVGSTAQRRARPATNKAASVAGGENPAQGGGGGGSSAYAIMAGRIANRVAEMAESITFVERPKGVQHQMPETAEDKKKPRKLEMRLNDNTKDSVAFSAPFLDNTLQKMLQLQNRMLKTTAELSHAEGVEEKTMKEHAAQSAELSRIIAMICAEKARQGA